MPYHLHLLLTPAEDVSLEKAIQFIKGNYSHRLKSKLDVWERSYTNHRISDAQDYTSHITYIEQNPVRANLPPIASQYHFSSASKLHPLAPTPPHLASPLLPYPPEAPNPTPPLPLYTPLHSPPPPT